MPLELDKGRVGRTLGHLGNGLVVVHVERLAGWVDSLNARAMQGVDKLVVHGTNAAHELAVRAFRVGLGGVVKRALHVVDHRKELHDEVLRGTGLLFLALTCGALAEVVPLGLQTQELVVGGSGVGARLLDVCHRENLVDLVGNGLLVYLLTVLLLNLDNLGLNGHLLNGHLLNGERLVGTLSLGFVSVGGHHYLPCLSSSTTS